MNTPDHPRRLSRRARSIWMTLIGIGFVVAAGVIAVIGDPFLGLGFAGAALVVFALAPTVIGSPSGTRQRPVSATPEELKKWREAHPGSTITDALNAHRTP
ncbi:hypothetical protein [Microbacterium sp. NPDC091662]|uniref:hypothetical protein n=1 Tax=Microbacterium sp. NPDC091662 TaxID=3364211 RepID=UPI0037FF964C